MLHGTDSATIHRRRLTRRLAVVSALLSSMAIGCASMRSDRRGSRPRWSDRPLLGAKSKAPAGPSESVPLLTDTVPPRTGTVGSAGLPLPGSSLASTASAPNSGAQVRSSLPTPAASRPAESAPSNMLQPPITTLDGPSFVRNDAPQASPSIAATPPASPPNTASPFAAGELGVATAAPAATSPSAPVASAETIRQVRELVAAGRNKLASTSNYRVISLRQELVGSNLQPEERVAISIRREPWAVLLEWPEGPSQGREVLYAPTPNDGLMHVKMSNSPLIPTIKIDPNSPIALKNSRHPISEAGLDIILVRIENAVDQLEQGQGDTRGLEYKGLVDHPAIGSPVHQIVRRTMAGETWLVCLSPDTKLPVFVEATGPLGELLERYRFERIDFDVPELLVASAFDPGARFGSGKGFLGRLTNVAASTPTTAPSAGTQVR